MKNKTETSDLILFRFKAGKLSKAEIANCSILEIIPEIDPRGKDYRNFWCILRGAPLKVFNRWVIGKLPDPHDLQIKVSELLAFDFSEEANHIKWSLEFKKFLFSLQIKLIELGFQKSDGIFLRNDFNFKLNF